MICEGGREERETTDLDDSPETLENPLAGSARFQRVAKDDPHSRLVENLEELC